MLSDGRWFRDNSTLEADICIAGAGAAGLVLAAELIRRGRQVLLLESGGASPDDTVSALNEGTLAGDDYAGLSATRARQIGGTAVLWNTPVGGATGAKYAPLDPIDLEGRFCAELGGAWSLDWDELARWYDPAQRVCGLGSFRYDAPLTAPGVPDLSPLVPRYYHLGTREALIDPMVRVLRDASTATLCTYATVLEVMLDPARQRVDALVVSTPGGARWLVRARQYVFAAGAVENARLLLGLAETARSVNAYDLIGRCFMEHPRDSSLLFVPRSPGFYHEGAFFDVHRSEGGHAVLGRLAVDPDVLRDNDLLNASVTLLPIPRRTILRGIAGFGPRASIAPLRRVRAEYGHGWSVHPAPPSVYDGFVLRLNAEQTPHPENRIVLGTRRDALGVRLPELRWRWRADDRRRLARLKHRIASAIDGSGLGRVMEKPIAIDPNAHHHAGTTRMHPDPRFGVVDADARVHGIGNLYVAGASVFPTAGFANPVLTIAALSLRLAHHLS